MFLDERDGNWYSRITYNNEVINLCRSKIKEDVIVKQSNINEMQGLILKGDLGVSQITLNVLKNDKEILNYNENKKE